MNASLTLVCAAATALSVAGLVWTVTSLDGRDRAWLRAVLAGRAAALRSALDAVAQGARSRMQSGAPAATLTEVSEMIDVVRLALSAGLSFDASLELFCAHRTSSLSHRLARALLSWRIGLRPRSDELALVASDMGVRALESFALAVGQALELGAPLADVLGSQAREIRLAHRAAVEREIERAPVKLLIPTGTLILPALLLSILGPLLAASGML